MAIGELQYRRGNTAAILSITPKDGELIVNTDTYKVWLGDGATAGGILQDGNTVKSVTGTTYTLVVGDGGKLLACNNSSGIAVTIDPGTLSPQSRFSVVNIGTGSVVITPVASTINGLSSLSLDQGDGALLSTDGSNFFAVIGKIAAPSSVLTMMTKTANYTLSTSDSGKHIDNIGAGGAVVLQLPPAARGLFYTASVFAAQYLGFQTDGTDQVSYQGNNSATGGFVRSNDQLSTLTIKAHGSGQWVSMNSDGAWGVDI